MKFKKTIITTLSLLVLPGISFAQTFKDIVIEATNISKVLMPLLFSIALVWFMWGVVDFIRNADNSEARKKGKIKMLWGIIALVAMVGYLGLTSIITNTFFGMNATIIPQLHE